MDVLPLSEVFTAPGAIAWAAVITYLVLASQAIPFIPLPEGSTARATAIALLAALVVIGGVLEAGAAFAPASIVGYVLAYANVLAAASGVRVATKVVAPTVTTAANEPKAPPPGG
jgi:hypothetical protein